MIVDKAFPMPDEWGSITNAPEQELGIQPKIPWRHRMTATMQLYPLDS